MRRSLLIAIAAWLALKLPATSAEPYQFQSEATATPLLELYTSEGCSSCPPAEAWLSRLKDSPRLWKDFVPLEFHVDYWDYLGWKDSLAAKAYSERQRAYAAQWRSRSVYTPGFVLNGKEWRGWSSGNELPRPSPRQVGVLKARSDDGKQWTVRFQPAGSSKTSSYEIHAALLGFDLSSNVKAGENRGRKLEHDFVVLAMAHAAAVKDGDALQARLSLNPKTPLLIRRLGFAAWVTPAKNLQPLQAFGGWLSSSNRLP